jgi:hypothetical protein
LGSEIENKNSMKFVAERSSSSSESLKKSSVIYLDDNSPVKSIDNST